jgi:hypothetical protein
MRDRGREDLCKDKRQNNHHHERVQNGPQHAKGHVAVSDSEVLGYQVDQQKLIIAVPH